MIGIPQKDKNSRDVFTSVSEVIGHNLALVLLGFRQGYRSLPNVREAWFEARNSLDDFLSRTTSFHGTLTIFLDPMRDFEGDIIVGELELTNIEPNRIRPPSYELIRVTSRLFDRRVDPSPLLKCSRTYRIQSSHCR